MVYAITFMHFLLLLSATYAVPRARRQATVPQTGGTAAAAAAAAQLPSNFRPAKQINGDKSSQSGHQQQNIVTPAAIASGSHVPVPQKRQQQQQQQQPQHRLHPQSNVQIQEPVQTQFVPTEPPKAGPPPGAPEAIGQLPPVDKTVDLDGDGALSLAEVQYAAFVHHGLSSNVIESLFNEVDKNRDGYLTSIEFNDIRPLVLAKAESAAQRYLQTVDTDHNGLLSLKEAQDYILKEYGIGNRDVERVWRLVLPNTEAEMNAILFSKLRRRIRGMSIRLARQIMKYADKNEDGHIDKKEAQQIAFEQEGISAGDVNEMVMSVDDNNDGELNAPEFADFERIVRARAVDTSKKALKVVDRDGSGTLTMDEAKRIAFDHYGFDEKILGPFFAQADENEDGQLDAVEFAGFRSVIRNKAVKNAIEAMQEIDSDGDGHINNSEAVAMARRQDDMDPKETFNLFVVADQDKSGKLDKVELADFLRLVRLSAIKFANDHFKEFDKNKDKLVTIDELEELIELKYKVDRLITRQFFEKVDVDNSTDLSPGELVDFRHEIRRYVSERDSQRAYDKSGAQDGERGSTEDFGVDSGADHNLSPLGVDPPEHQKPKLAASSDAGSSRKPSPILIAAPKPKKVPIDVAKKKETAAQGAKTQRTKEFATTTTISAVTEMTLRTQEPSNNTEQTSAGTTATESTVEILSTAKTSVPESSVEALSSLSPPKSPTTPSLQSERSSQEASPLPETFPVNDAPRAGDIADEAHTELFMNEELGSVTGGAADGGALEETESTTGGSELDSTLAQIDQENDGDRSISAGIDGATSKERGGGEGTELELEPEQPEPEILQNEDGEQEEGNPVQNEREEMSEKTGESENGSLSSAEKISDDLKQPTDDVSSAFQNEETPTEEVKAEEVAVEEEKVPVTSQQQSSIKSKKPPGKSTVQLRSISRNLRSVDTAELL